MAAYFMSRTGVAYELVTVADDADPAETCASVVEAGNVVVAGPNEVDPVVFDCLTGAGAALVSHDGAGERAHVEEAGVVPTRRGTTATLRDLLVWPSRDEFLGGKVGLVSTERRQPQVERALPQLRSGGIEIAATAFISDDDELGDIDSGVQRFRAAGVDVVVLALPVEQAGRWALREAVLWPNGQYVVADVDDAIVNESYPAVLEGAASFTSVRVPWFAREHGETDAQADCRSAWEANVATPEVSDSQELADVFVWCQHAELVATTLASAGDVDAFVERARRSELDSPITSVVKSLPGDEYGPAENATLLWKASCSCWEEHDAFRERE